MLESDTVPEYRAATGRWMDAYDRILDLSHYPDLSIVNAYRFRLGVAKLEALAQKTEMQNIADDGIISLLRNHLSIEVVRFCFNPVEIHGILEAIRNRLVERLHDIELRSAQSTM